MADTITPAQRALDELARRDPVIDTIRQTLPTPHFHDSRETPFESLVRGITYQQLAAPAAHAIFGRVLAEVHDKLLPERIAALSEEQLRQAGLSGAKSRAVLDLAVRVLEGNVELNPAKLRQLDDDTVIAQLSAVHGIGPWSAQMFLMFQLERLDVWPTADLGVRKGYASAWKIPLPTPKQLHALGEQYHPYRSIVAMLCWEVAARDRELAKERRQPAAAV